MKILVTGASEGIGGAICRLFAKQCNVEKEPLDIVLTVSGSKSMPKQLIDDLEALGARTLLIKGDITRSDVCEDIAAQTLEFCGGLDAFISNAGGVSPGKLKDISTDVWDMQFNLNVRTTFILAQKLHSALKACQGTIIAISSMSGLSAHLGQAAYSPAKSALISLCQNLAQEWACDGIRVNCVAPGMINTPLTSKVYDHEKTTEARTALVPLGRIGTPEDIAQIVAFLASDKSSYITGQVILADGGLSDSILGLIPGLPK